MTSLYLESRKRNDLYGRRFHFVEFEDLANYLEASVDVIGIVKSATGIYSQQGKNGMVDRRDITLINSRRIQLKAVSRISNNFA